MYALRVTTCAECASKFQNGQNDKFINLEYVSGHSKHFKIFCAYVSLARHEILMWSNWDETLFLEENGSDFRLIVGNMGLLSI